MLLYGIGTGMIFMPLTMIGVSGIAVSDTGAASGLLNTTQQMGGSLGLSILVTVFGAATSGVTGSRASVLATGASAGFLAAAGFAAGGRGHGRICGECVIDANGEPQREWDP
jgi:hypothetical protein